MKKFLIIIPVFNEAETLYEVALRTIKHASTSADIYFINDGSTDSSPAILDRLASEFSEISVLHKHKNEGYGSSLISGFEIAAGKKYEFAVTMDCDEQHQPDDLKRFFEFDHTIDIVSGSRYHKDSSSSGIIPPVDRVEINRRITKKLNQVYHYELTDSFCGYKRYRTEKLKKGNFKEYGYAFPMEFWAYAHRYQLSISELAVDKIYITDDRSFGEDLDKKRKRYAYYLNAWKRAHYKYNGNKLKLEIDRTVSHEL